MSAPIDIEAGAQNIDDADRVADSPHGQSQYSISFDGAAELMLSNLLPAGVVKVGGIFSVASWFKPSAQPLTEFHTICDISPDAGQVNSISLHLRNTGVAPATNAVQFLLGDSGGTFIQNPAWTTGMTGTLWRHVVFTWGGTDAGMRMYFDGVDLGTPDFAGIGSDGTLDDTNSRRMGVGRGRHGVGPMDGQVALTAWWNGVQLSALEAAAIFNGRDIDFDLNANSGNYQSAASLVHLHQTGNQPSPNLGAETAALANPAVDIEVAAVGITDADRVVDVP